MNDDDVKYLVDMAKSLAEMNGKMTILCDRIAAHEARITHLEDRQVQPVPQPAQQSESQNLLQIALKAILFATATAMALAGAGKFISQ